jgi:hypothetical protein
MLILVWIMACQGPPIDEPLPAIIAEGERVRVATEVVDQVCTGTLAQLDAELARVEQELGLDPAGATVDVYLLGPESLVDQCGPDTWGCSAPGKLYLRAELLDARIVHEFVHERIAHTPAAGAPPLFDEGLAAAVAPPWCPPLPSWVSPDPESLLAATTPEALPEHGEYLGGELLRWLLDTHGPAAVLAFMADIADPREPDNLRASYLEHFGSEFDTDIFAHLRPLDEPLSREQSGCLAPSAPAATSFLGVALAAELDCDATGVHNDFAEPGRMYVEWTLEVSADDSGEFQLLGQLPADSELRIEPCGCRHGAGTWWSPLDERIFQFPIKYRYFTLSPGIHRVRWSGPTGAVLDVEIVETCDFFAQNCLPGLVCTLGGECIEPPVDPQQHGEPCNIDSGDVMGTCDVGLVCLGDFPNDWPDDGVCMSYCGDGRQGVECPEGLSCQHAGVCAQGCDPLAQDCEPGWACAPEFETGAGACLPEGGISMLERCEVWFFDYCAQGLTCTTLPEIEGCQGDNWTSSGCCTPICDPAAAVSTCPPELPVCQADEGDVLGSCVP